MHQRVAQPLVSLPLLSKIIGVYGPNLTLIFAVSLSVVVFPSARAGVLSKQPIVLIGFHNIERMKTEI